MLLSGCGWLSSFVIGSDNSTPPAELKALAQTLPIQTLWSVNASSGSGDTFVHFRPARNGDRLFVAGVDGDVSAIDVRSGSRIWRFDTDIELSAGVGLSAELAIVGSIDGELIALAQSDGSEVWRTRLSSEILTPPVSQNGIVVARAIDGTFTGLNALDGSKVWTYQYTVPALTLRGASRPVIVQDLVIAGLDNGKLQLLALNSGTLVGERRIAPPRGRTELDRMVDIDAEPRLAGSELFVAAYQGNLSALNLDGGQLIWSRDFSSYSGLEVDNNQVYISDAEGAVWALDRRSGSGLWKQSDLLGRRLTAPAISGSFVVVGDLEGYVHWLNRDSGRIVGRVRADNEAIESRPLAVGDTIFVLSSSGQLGAYRSTQ